MKFGYIDFDRTVNWYWDNSWNNKALLNIGDAAEYKVIRQLYGKLGIPDEKTLPLCISELTSYRGEKLIVALNISLDSYVGYNRILEELSPDIVPVFLGMCFTDSNLTPKQIECLKRFSPIGCRDQRSYDLMQKLGIESYLNGCTASCIQSCYGKGNTEGIFRRGRKGKTVRSRDCYGCYHRGCPAVWWIRLHQRVRCRAYDA